jgi:hypothetical protein
LSRCPEDFFGAEQKLCSEGLLWRGSYDIIISVTAPSRTVPLLIGLSVWGDTQPSLLLGQVRPIKPFGRELTRRRERTESTKCEGRLAERGFRVPSFEFRVGRTGPNRKDARGQPQRSPRAQGTIETREELFHQRLTRMNADFSFPRETRNQKRETLQTRLEPQMHADERGFS